MDTLFWFLIEGFTAMVLVIGIVWWTWPRRGPGDEDK